MADQHDWPECEKFYDLMQHYRHKPIQDVSGTVFAYEAVKKWLRENLAATPQAGVPREREALQQILRTPNRPFPDPGAHSMEAYARAVHAAWCEMRFIAMAALKEDAAPAPLDDARDSERLDWLELTIRDGSYQSIIHDIAAFCQHAYKHFGKGPAIRTAIDTARAAIAKD